MKIQAKIIYIITLFALVFTCLCPHTGKGIKHVYAAENATSLDGTAVMDDLQGVDLSAVTAELTGDKLYVISFTEYAFAFNKNANGNFGLYVYVYNPAAKNVITNSTQHAINLGVEYNGTEVTGYGKFSLRCLSVSEDGKYVKFKVIDKVSEATGETILSRVCKQKTQRLYDVAEIEVCHEYGAIAESYAVGKRFIYTGFAAGYGQSAGADSTLDYFSENSETVQLDVHPTQYRLDGNNGKNIYTQDSLHSVYFTVPNEYGEKYGEMTAVHAQWLDAVLKPYLITGNQDAYNAILPYLGENDLTGLDYSYYGALKGPYDLMGGVGTGYDFDYGFNCRSYTGGVFMGTDKSHVIKPLYIMFNAGTGSDSADGFRPPAEGEGSLTEKMQQATAQFGGELTTDLLEERYAVELFENIAEKITDARIKDTDEFKIMNVGIDKKEWWEFWKQGDQPDKNTLDRFVGVKAIETVTEGMTSGSKKEVCERLKIGEQDYEAFIDYYEANKAKGTVYLFRYQISDYISQETTLVKPLKVLGTPDKIDTNAYFFQETANIGFDVIDITLTNEQGEHVLGVAAKPIDVFPTPTPPLVTTDDTPWGELLFWLKMIVGIILGCGMISLICIVVPPIGTVILHIIILPFKAVGSLFKAIGNLFHKKE